MKKKFDFDHIDFTSQCSAKCEYIIQKCNQVVTEEEFIEAIQNMPKHEHWSYGHSPSKAKHVYRQLKNNFGFFEGNKI